MQQAANKHERDMKRKRWDGSLDEGAILFFFSPQSREEKPREKI